MQKNIWVAAGDGELVSSLIISHSKAKGWYLSRTVFVYVSLCLRVYSLVNIFHPKDLDRTRTQVILFISLVIHPFIYTLDLSPNIPDNFSYTPMSILFTLVLLLPLTFFSRHAAASYGHLDVLQYLISQGHFLFFYLSIHFNHPS
jgi:hypothetical protein